MIGRQDGEMRVAVEAVLQAAVLSERIRQRFGAGPMSRLKDDRSPVTVADLAVQALVARELAEGDPTIPLVAEEERGSLTGADGAPLLREIASLLARSSAVAGTEEDPAGDVAQDAVLRWIGRGAAEPGSRFWTLDPIDGTKGFLRGDQYAIALALIEDGRVRFGTLACPLLPSDPSSQGELGALLTATRGEGAWIARLDTDGDQGRVGRWRRLRADRVDPAPRRFVESVEPGHGDHRLQADVAEAIGIDAPPLRLDSQAKYAAVADGRAALYLRLPSPASPDYREKIWDHAAGSIIVTEAGGRVTDMYGRELDFSRGRRLTDNRGVIASTGPVHEAALSALDTTPRRHGPTPAS